MSFIEEFEEDEREQSLTETNFAGSSPKLTKNMYKTEENVETEENMGEKIITVNLKDKREEAKKLHEEIMLLKLRGFQMMGGVLMYLIILAIIIRAVN